MDPRYLILWLFVAVVAICSLAVLAFVFFSARAAWRYAKAKRYGRMGAAVVLAASPFLVFGGWSWATEHHVESRRAMIEQLERTPLGRGYPRRLEVYGDIPDVVASGLIASGVFSSITVIDSRRYPADARAAVWTIRVRTDEQCRTLARAWVAAKRQGQLFGEPDRSRLDACATRTGRTYEGFTPLGDAVVLLTGHATTLRDGNTVWAGGNLELRLRRGGSDQLVDYWEDLHYEQPVSPLLITPAGYVSRSQHGAARKLNTAEFLMRAVDSTALKR